MARPFVKWAGGKGQILEIIREMYPEGLGKNIRKYAEPFVGGGAVLFDILNFFDLDAVYISDSNWELMNTYVEIRDHVDQIIDKLYQLQNEYLPLDDNRRKVFYYHKRDRFNEIKSKKNPSDNTENAVLFLFLNRTCFNGLYRVNKTNCFNVPIGSYKKPVLCNAENLANVSMKLKNVIITASDYHDSEAFIDKETFVYFDPPYRPLNATSCFTSYTEKVFTDEDQTALAEYVQVLNRKGAFIMVSNSDPKNTDPEDKFFEVRYDSQEIHHLTAMRMINSKADSRGHVDELLILNYRRDIENG